MTLTRRSTLTGALGAFTLAMTPLGAMAQDSGVVEMVMGAEDAPVELIEYASYTCPHCANFHQGTFKQLKEEFIDTGKVKFIYREVYFDRFGLWASIIARCGGPERFFGITDLLYEQQAEWSRAGDPVQVANALRKVGKVAGLSEEQIDACFNDAEGAQALVTWYQENATRDDIQATPSFLLNGRKVSNQNYADFKKLIEAELS